MSTKSTFDWQKSPQLAEATKELGLVHSQSPLLRPKAKQDICSADVALFTATAKLDPQ